MRSYEIWALVTTLSGVLVILVGSVIVIVSLKKLRADIQALQESNAQRPMTVEEITRRLYVLEALRGIIVGTMELDREFLEANCNIPNLQELLGPGRLSPEALQAFMRMQDIPNTAHLACRNVLSHVNDQTQRLT